MAAQQQTAQNQSAQQESTQQPGAASRPTRAPRAASPQRPRRLRVALGVFRLALAAIELIALYGNFNYVLGFSSFATGNFFSYFTIQSAMLAVVLLIVAGVIAITWQSDPPWLGVMRTITVCYLLVSGIVFAVIVLQASSRSYRVDVPWSDTLLHFVVPLLALFAWAVDASISPRSAPMPWSALAWVLPFPSIWLVFTLIRGADVGWYPYFFLDSTQVGGPVGIAFYCALVLAIFLGVTAMLVVLSRFLTALASARSRRRDQLRKNSGWQVLAP